MAHRCTLAEAIAKSVAGSTIELATAGTKGLYIGNWTVSTLAFSASAAVTIAAAPGTARPTLDGNHGAARGCQTKTCNGPVLTVASGVHLNLVGVSIINAGSAGRGGAIDNAGGGTVMVLGSVFSGNRAVDGGAIDNGDHGSGILTVSASSFSANSATGNGGAIDNGDHGSGSLTVSASSFSGNTATGDGGAIDNGDHGSGSLSVATSTFANSTAAGDGGAIDNADAGAGGLTVTTSTFVANRARDGGAIDNAEDKGKGSASVSQSTLTTNQAKRDGGAIDNGDDGSSSFSLWASTLSANGAVRDGGAVDNGDNGGTSAMFVTADIFNGSCARPGGAWDDAGYNVGNNATCLNAGTADVSTDARALGPLAANGGPTKTIVPQAASPALSLVPDPTTVTVNGAALQLCPTTDQRGVHSGAGHRCNAGSYQSS
jgi:hypothetical protein